LDIGLKAQPRRYFGKAARFDDYLARPDRGAD
jgi:hypothetical protein